VVPLSQNFSSDFPRHSGSGLGESEPLVSYAPVKSLNQTNKVVFTAYIMKLLFTHKLYDINYVAANIMLTLGSEHFEPKTCPETSDRRVNTAETVRGTGRALVTSRRLKRVSVFVQRHLHHWSSVVRVCQPSATELFLSPPHTCGTVCRST